MKKIILLLVAVFVLVLSNQVFATNWQFVHQDQTPQCGDLSVYFDTESVARNGDTVIFYMLHVFNSPCSGATSVMYKEEANLSSRQYRFLEVIGYDANSAEIGRQGMTEWDQILPDTHGETIINRALQYAK
jgi:uncharacterized protein YxeA